MNRFLMVGVFVIAGLVLFTTGLFMIGNRHEAFARHVELYTEFSNDFRERLSGLCIHHPAGKLARMDQHPPQGFCRVTGRDHHMSLQGA
jgi:hypothetical protein